MPLKLALGIGFLLSPVAGAMAFLITYEEYRRHQLPPAACRRAAVRVGLVTTAFFLASSSVLGIVLARILGARS